jgi:fructokinase
VSAPGFLVVGEALVDVVPGPDGTPRDLPGGSPANVALTLGRLGRRVRLATTLARDARGHAVRAWLEDSGVVVDAATPASGRTSSAVVTLDEHGAASYDFDLTWDLPRVVPGDAAVVHVGSVATVLAPGDRVVLDLVTTMREDCVVSFDPNARPALSPDVDRARDRVESLVRSSDVVKVSDEDLGWYHPRTGSEDVAARWAAAGPALVVVTRGGDGAVAVRHDGRRLETGGVRVRVADTVGAGDTFSGVLLHALADLGVHGPAGRDRLRALSDDEVAIALHTATVGAAVTVSRPGADPPDREELASAMLGR